MPYVRRMHTPNTSSKHQGMSDFALAAAAAPCPSPSAALSGTLPSGGLLPLLLPLHRSCMHSSGGSSPLGPPCCRRLHARRLGLHLPGAPAPLGLPHAACHGMKLLGHLTAGAGGGVHCVMLAARRLTIAARRPTAAQRQTACGFTQMRQNSCPLLRRMHPATLYVHSETCHTQI